jgi:methionyl-tRNA formyltransferase
MEAIYAVGGRLACIVTLEDQIAPAKSGRVFVDDFAARHALPVHKTRSINASATIDYLRAQALDWLFIIGWSQIARPDVLAVVGRGAIGMHPTLLPVGRGRAAIPWAILKGLPETGVSMFVLDEGVDTGPLIGQEIIPLTRRETATTLYDKVGAAHRALMMRVWPALEAGTLHPESQHHAAATLWPGRTPDDGRVTSLMSCDEVDRLVRATTRPYPGAFIDLPSERLRLWAGEPVSRGAAPAAARVIHLVDGDFVVHDATSEPLPDDVVVSG